MADVRIRPLVHGDAAAVAALSNALSQALHGADDLTAEEVVSWLNIPNLDTFAAERADRLVGYMDVRRTPSARIPIDVRVHPDARGSDVAEALLAEVDRWAAANGQEGDVVRCFGVDEDNAELVEALRAAGYAPVRASWDMRIELDDEPPPASEWPGGMAVRPIRAPEEEHAIYELDNEVFEDAWDFRQTAYENWRRWTVESPRYDPSLWFVAEADGEPAGILLCGPHRSGDPSHGWVDTLGVRKPWRGRGLGSALLRHGFRELHARGMRRVELDVDTENTSGAVRLYERVGMRPARRTGIWEKPRQA